MQAFHNRSEHDFVKLLAKDIRELYVLIEDQEEATKVLQDITGLIDGYFLKSRERVRKEDLRKT